MIEKDSVLRFESDSAVYLLPLAALDYSEIMKKLGSPAEDELDKITAAISIAPVDRNIASLISGDITASGMKQITEAYNFKVTFTYKGITLTVDELDRYVEKYIELPVGIQPDDITTGIYVDGTGFKTHIPTRTVKENGRYYAVLSSMGNGIYTVIYNNVEFVDLGTTAWAETHTVETVSRLIIKESANKYFTPGDLINRAEFADILVKALGLERRNAESRIFSDVPEGAWYYNAVSAAYEYGLLSGLGDGTFRPDDTLTREQAMVMVARAMKLTGLYRNIGEAEAYKLIAAYSDAEATSDWSRTYIAECIKAGVISGKAGNVIAPDDHLTRAETAVLINKLLQISGLIN